MQRLFNLGGRKFVVANVGPTGCIPNQKDINKAVKYLTKLVYFSNAAK